MPRRESLVFKHLCVKVRLGTKIGNNLMDSARIRSEGSSGADFDCIPAPALQHLLDLGCITSICLKEDETLCRNLP